MKLAKLALFFIFIFLVSGCGPTKIEICEKAAMADYPSHQIKCYGNLGGNEDCLCDLYNCKIKTCKLRYRIQFDLKGDDTK